MAGGSQVSRDKSMGDLGWEAVWFTGHSLLACITLLFVVVLMSAFHPAAEDTAPMLFAMLLAFTIPACVGFAVANLTRNIIGRYVWISGLLLFVAACVWVINLPTGPGLCAECGPGHLIERIWRTFFAFQNGSGLLSGEGILIGCWTPLALIGYAVGSKLGLDHSTHSSTDLG
jgi:hypothetical protein